MNNTMEDILPSHLMDGNIMDTTEVHEAFALEPPVFTMRSGSPEQTAAAHRTSKIPNGGRGGLTRSPSFKQEVPNGRMVKQSIPQLPYATSATGLVYDVRMRFHVEVKPEVNQGVHPEDPRRIYSIYKELVDAGLVDDPESPGLSPYLLGRIPARSATREEICAVHTERHYDWVIGLERWSNDDLHHVGNEMDSIYLSKNSPMCARLSAGGAIEACRAILNKQVKNSIAVIRPPGHHAEHDQAMGFCLFNNVPIATKACQREFGDACRKVLILDWDVHHGNGVQQAFYDDPNVLYISLHVHQGGKFYPSGDYGDHLHCGEGLGLGKNINIPWKMAGMTDADYLLAFQKVVMPIAQDFAPDLVIVSAGFDAAEGDMLGKCHVSPAGYAHMTHMLMSLANGKIAVCLEGGYNLRSIAVSALAVTRTLMGEPPARPVVTSPTPAAVDTVELVLRQQAKFWPCLFPRDPSQRLRDMKADRLHDVIREWQANWLWENLEMTDLFIAHSKASRSFNHQVLATANHFDERPLLVIFHDPPEIVGIADPRTQKIEAHNSWLNDNVRTYVQWAVQQNFAVIDVNIPKHFTGIEDDYEYAEEATDNRKKETLQLATYLWENYIELGDSTHIFFMGIGSSYASVVDLLKANDRCRDRLTKIFGFIDHKANLPSYKSATDDYLDRWYRDVSRVFVAKSHYVWEKAKVKAPSKRWGSLVLSEFDDVQDMLLNHQKAVFAELTELTEDWQIDIEPKVGATNDGMGR